MKTEFSRQPRVLPDMPTGDMNIPNPPQIQSKPEISWFAVLVPPLVMLTITVLMALSMQSMFMMLSIAMTVMTLITSLTTAANQIRKFKKNKMKREELYIQFIKDKRSELEIARTKQHKAFIEMFPEPSVCLARIEEKDDKLFEKTPVFNDFLSLRIGVGNMPMSLSVSYEKQAILMESDPLMAEPERLATDFMQVRDVPVVMELNEAGIAGITGENQLRLKTMNALLLQLITHQGYDDVKVVILAKEENLKSFKWIKNTFHIWDESIHNRYLLCGKAMAHQTLSELYTEIHQRAIAEGIRKIVPRYVFIVDDESLLENELINKYLYTSNKDLGVYSIFLADTKAYLPMNCEIFTHIGNKVGELVKRSTNESISYTPDRVEQAKLVKAGLLLTAIEIKSVQGTFEVPNSVTLNELYHINKNEELNIIDLWKKNRTYQGMSVPIGLKSGRKVAFLDLHETGHGPHGLVAGTTGSGKSELLQSIIISLAMNYHPHDINFVLIDYKGGGMADVFKGLPHLVGTITNLGGNETNRALLSINSEIKKRQVVLSEYGVSNIDKYQKLYYSGDHHNMPKLPHLIMIADEFAELKQDQPEFMKELVSAARVGRSLGIHLILATQKPAGIVDDQIWSNSKFKICLKVQDSADSNDVLKKPDAAMIKLPGRAYLQVGNDEIYELFQSAFSGADYISNQNEEIRDKKDKTIYSIALNGKTEKIYPQIEEKIVDKQCPTQLEAMVEYITTTAKENGIVAIEGPWKPSLLEVVPLIDDQKLSLTPKSIVIPLGLFDNPREQSQGVFNYDLENDGNMLVYGASGNGKSHLLTLMMISSAHKYHSEDIIFYGLDFAGGTLKKCIDIDICGDVITLEEEDKLSYLLYKLKQIQNERKRIFNSHGVNDINEYKRKVGNMPVIMIIIDNYYALSETYEDIEEELLVLIREGMRFGLYFSVSVTDPSIIRYKVSVNFKSVITFELSDSGEYAGIVGRCEGIEPHNIKGRCLVRNTIPFEAQIYDFMGTKESWNQVIDELNDNHKTVDVEKAVAIPVIDDNLSISDLNLKIDNNLVIGKDFNTLAPLELDFEINKALLILGDGNSYKADVFMGWFNTLMKNNLLSGFLFYGLDSKNMELYNFVNDQDCIDLADEDNIDEIMDQLRELLDQRKHAFFEGKRSGIKLIELQKSWKQIVIVINGVSEFTQSDKYSLIDFAETLMKDYYQLKLCVIGIDSVSDMSSNYDAFAKLLQNEQSGIIFDSIKEQNMFSVKVPYNYKENLTALADGYRISGNSFIPVRFGFEE